MLALAVRVLDSGGGGCCGGNSTRIERAELRIGPPASRPDPALMRLEILSAEPLIAAYPEGKAERERQLDTAVKAIKLDALDKGNQQALRCLAARSAKQTRDFAAVHEAIQHCSGRQQPH